jgi:hypothetical protein
MKTTKEEILEGKDAELTDMIYGVQKTPEHRDTDILPENNGILRGESNPLQLFINMYQPGEFVTKENFRKHLLQILNDWHKSMIEKEEWSGNRQIGISLKQTAPHVQWGDKFNGNMFYVKAESNFDKWLFDDTMTTEKKTVGQLNQKQLHKELDAFIAKFKEENND